jgi:long-chain fatty acid transport protein
MPSYTTVYSQGRTRAFFASASTTLVALLMASQAWGSGYQIKEQSALYMGTAGAGTAALAADASSAWYNPAAITRIKDHQLVIAGVFIHADSDFNPNFATNMAGTVLASRGEEDGNKLSFVPSLHYTAEITDRVYLGLSVTAPFGLATEYSENSILRYMATRSELRTVDISPSIAYRLNDHFSFAVGADAVWAKAHLDLQTSFPATVPVPTLVDGFQRNAAEDWGWGWHAAVLWEMCENTRFGANYRSHVNIHADGESEAVVPSNPLVAISGLRTIYGVHADVTLPDVLDVSAYHAFNREFAVMADVSWTNWSKFRTLRLRYDAPPTAADGTGRTPTDTFEHWDDTMRVALGMEYTPCDKYKLRFGMAWDESPVDTQFRTARIPDSDRIWVGVGLGFALSQNMWVDLGYAHIFFRSANIDERSPFAAQTTTPVTVAQLRGKFNTSVDIAGLQFRWTFN